MAEIVYIYIYIYNSILSLLDLNVLYQLHIWNVTIQYRLSSQEIYCIPTAFRSLGNGLCMW